MFYLIHFLSSAWAPIYKYPLVYIEYPILLSQNGSGNQERVSIIWLARGRTIFVESGRTAQENLNPYHVNSLQCLMNRL